MRESNRHIVKDDDRDLGNIEFPLRATYYPLGFAVEISTNSSDVLSAARESWGLFQPTHSEPAVKMSIGVYGEGSPEPPPIPLYRGRENLMTVMADMENYGVVDFRRGYGFAWFTEVVAKNRPYLRYHFLEGMCLMMLEGKYLTPIHAACVSRHGRGVLLCADSGVGKSSLSFACARRGWTFISDDACSLIRKNPGRVVVGNPYQMRFRESALDLFPELHDQRRAAHNGEMTIEVVTERLPQISTAPQTTVDYVVFLKRKHGEPTSLRPYSKEKALISLQHVVCYGEMAKRGQQIESLERLLAAEVLELRYSDLDSAVDELETKIDDSMVRALISAETTVDE